jgi:predicted ATP-dependent endonuclease of OLD family
MKVIQSPPNLVSIPNHISNKQLAQLETEYIKSLPRNGKITLLLDEPEKALSIPKQVELFDVLVKLSDNFQLIIATHSPFILGYKKANIIDVTPGYMKECKGLIKKYF